MTIPGRSGTKGRKGSQGLLYPAKTSPKSIGEIPSAKQCTRTWHACRCPAGEKNNLEGLAPSPGLPF